MDYEKKYKDALSYAKSLITEVDNKDRVYYVDDIKNIFPELAESENEKIRREIRDFICWARDRGSITMEQKEKVDSWITWLEKQKAPKCSDEHPNELPCYKQVINNLSKAMEE